MLTLIMFSKVPRGKLKKVMNFVLWFDIHFDTAQLRSFKLFDKLECYNLVSFKLRPLKRGVKWSEYRCFLCAGVFFNKVEDRLKKKRLRQCSLRTLLEICSFKQFFTSIPERFTRKVYFSNKLNSQSIHASVNITKIKNFLRSFSKVFVVETRLSNILGVSKKQFKKSF